MEYWRKNFELHIKNIQRELSWLSINNQWTHVIMNSFSHWENRRRNSDNKKKWKCQSMSHTFGSSFSSLLVNRSSAFLRSLFFTWDISSFAAYKESKLEIEHLRNWYKKKFTKKKFIYHEFRIKFPVLLLFAFRLRQGFG